MLAVTPAFPTVISTYTTQATWLAASNTVQNIDFEGLAPANGVSSTYYSLTLDNVTFSGEQGAGSFGMNVIDTNFSQYFNFGTNDALELPNIYSLPAPYFQIVLPAAVTSFGVNLMSVSPQALSYSVTAGGSTFTVPTYTTPTPGFFGATFDAPVTTIDIAPLGLAAGAGAYELLDNFSFGAADATQDSGGDTPEAATLLMIGLGLVALTALRRRHAAV